MFNMLAAYSVDQSLAGFCRVLLHELFPGCEEGPHLLQFSRPTVVSARLVLDPPSMLRTSAPLDVL